MEKYSESWLSSFFKFDVISSFRLGGKSLSMLPGLPSRAITFSRLSPTEIVWYGSAAHANNSAMIGSRMFLTEVVYRIRFLVIEGTYGHINRQPRVCRR